MTDWNKQSYVTSYELAKMHSHERAWFKNQPKIWRYVTDRDVLYNLAHPDNKDMFLADLVAEIK